MTEYEKDLVMQGIRELAKTIGVSPYAVKRCIYEEMNEENQREDIEECLMEHGYEFTNDNVTSILSCYREAYDREYGVWDNVGSAIDAAIDYGMPELSYRREALL